MAKAPPEPVQMSMLKVAMFHGRSVFNNKTKFVITLEMDEISGAWYTFVYTKNERIPDLDTELFRLEPRMAIEKWRERVARASEFGWNEFDYAIIRLPLSSTDTAFEITDGMWFFDPDDDDDEAKHLRVWLDQFFPWRKKTDDKQ